jgi:hypothetical protein
MLWAKPQRHRGTEKAQSRPPTQEPRRHKDTKKSQSPPTQPPGFQRRGAEAQRRRGNLAGFFALARFRPSDGRKPLGLESAPKTSFRIGFQAQRLALFKRKPRHLSSSFNKWERHAPSPKHGKEERQNRRATGTSAGEKWGVDGRSRPEASHFSPATGDPRSPVVLPPRSGTAFQAQHPPLCVGGWVGGLCVFVSSCLRRGRVGGLCVSVPLWLFVCRIPRIG